jgi:hypothetical protein
MSARTLLPTAITAGLRSRARGDKAACDKATFTAPLHEASHLAAEVTPCIWTAFGLFDWKRLSAGFFAAKVNPLSRECVSSGGAIFAQEARMGFDRWMYIVTALSLSLAVALTAYSFYGS